ncbi:N-acetylmuramoyl-L-alanine amidase [Sporosarcina sp. G11-34]|uniref:N-acetylmuramoyl-L-alanine amidase n=1 Tax=Sporosarcina sp. G11-34 TaxID=2849605 RepID=UPI0022A97C4C|nr:N-acetylmuramoyl-L-alanine amidase [Sporosarcina sp. G11-34]
MEMKQQLVSSRKSTYGSGNLCNYITIHETANYDKGTGAQTHANLQSNGYSASWHYQVDDKEVVQSFPDTIRCWHAGDGKGRGNYESIGIEICVNSDSDFKKAVQNAAWLVRQLLATYPRITMDRVVQHNKWSGKNCPFNLRSGKKGIDWAGFKHLVEAGDPVPSKPQSPPSKPEQGKSSTSTSIVDWMNTNKMDSSFANRAKLAKQYGITEYSGTAAQNNELLDKLQGKTADKPSPQPTSSKVLRYGDSGADVKAMQQALASVYFYPDKGAKDNGIDGLYGTKTRDAVRRFQSVHTPAEVDGIYGPKTRVALDKVRKK